MTRKCKNPPLIGEAFNPEQMNMGETFYAMAEELEWYLPKSKWDIKGDLKVAASSYARIGTDDESDGDSDSIQLGIEASRDAEDALTEWARTVERHDYISFTFDGWFAGFRIDVDSAVEDADWLCSCNGSREQGSPRKPGEGAGLEVFINDHGNVTAWLYGANGHKRELFAVV